MVVSGEVKHSRQRPGGLEMGGVDLVRLPLKILRIEFGDRVEARHGGREQPGKGRLPDEPGRVLTIIGSFERTVGEPRQIVDSRHENRAGHRLRRTVADIGDVARDVRRARRLPHHEQPARIDAELRGVLLQPADGEGDIVAARGPRCTRRQPVGHRHADTAVACRPGADVVVKRRVGAALVAGDEASAVNEDQRRARRRTFQGTEDIEAVPRVAAVRQVAPHQTDIRGGARRRGREQGHGALDHRRRDGPPQRFQGLDPRDPGHARLWV